MESNQPRVEEVASNNIVEGELQPPKRKKKKVSFAVWWELHAPEELKISAENIKQDSSMVVENESITNALEAVDQKGGRQPLESESTEKNQMPFKTCSEEHVPIEQNDPLVREEESTAGVQETSDMADKEQPSKSKEQPPRRRRNQVKMIPFQLWLEEQAPADLRISDESTELEDVSPVATQELITVLEETPQKEQPIKSGDENVEKQDTSLPEEEGDKEDSFKKEICKEEPVISITQLVAEMKSISKSQEKVDQTGKKKTKRIKKMPLLWKSFPESDACIDLSFFAENSDINGPLPEKESYQAALPSSGKKSFWKMLPNSEPSIDVCFFAENTETPGVSMPAQDRDEAASLKEESNSENTVISTTQVVAKEGSVLIQETQEQKGEQCQSTGKPKDNIQTESLTEVPDKQAAENVEGECLTENQNLPQSSEKKTSQPNSACFAKSKKSELELIEVPMKQLAELFDINQKLNAQLKQEKDLVRKLLSEKRQRNKTMISVQTQTDSQDRIKQKKVNYQSASVQTEMNVRETSLKPVCQTISTQTDTDVLGTSCHLKPARQSTSTQTEVDVLENRCQFKPAYQTIATQTEFFLLLRKQPSQTQLNGNPDLQTKQFKRSKPQEAIEEQMVSTKQQHGDRQDVKKPSKRWRRRIRRAAMRAASELETLTNDTVSGENSEEISVPQTVGDQKANIINKIRENQTAIGKLQQALEEETVSTKLQNGDRQDVKKPSKRWRRRIRRAATRATSELETLNNDTVSGENSEEQEVSVPQTVGDQKANIINKIRENQTAICKLQQALEEETVSTKLQNGDRQDVKKPSKRYRRKIRRAAKKAASKLANLNNNTPGEHTKQKDVSKLVTVGDQTVAIKNSFTHMIETEIAEVQITEEDTVSTAQQNRDQLDEKKPSKKYKRKNKRKAAMKAACELENLNNDTVSGENPKLKEVSISETVRDQTATIVIEIHKNKTDIGEPQQATDDKMVPERQNGDQQKKKKPSTKFKRKKKRKMAMKARLKTTINLTESDHHLMQNAETPKTDLGIPEIPQSAVEQIETKPCKISEDVTGKVPVVSTEWVRGIMVEQKTSPPEIILNEDVILTTPQEPESEAVDELAELNNICEEEESPKKKMSLWKRFKKALCPTLLRRFKDRCRVHPA